VGLCVLGPQPDRPLIADNRLVQFSPVAVDVGQVVDRLGILRRDPQGLLEVGRGLVQPAQPCQGAAEIVVGLGKAGMNPDRPLQRRDRLLVAPGPERNEPQVKPRLAVVGHLVEQFPARPLRFGQVPGLVQTPGLVPQGRGIGDWGLGIGKSRGIGDRRLGVRTS